MGSPLQIISPASTSRVEADRAGSGHLDLLSGVIRCGHVAVGPASFWPHSECRPEVSMSKSKHLGSLVSEFLIVVFPWLSVFHHTSAVEAHELSSAAPPSVGVCRSRPCSLEMKEQAQSSATSASVRRRRFRATLEEFLGGPVDAVLPHIIACAKPPTRKSCFGSCIRAS